ncbi:ATP-binding protein [Paraglaciecola chathamensis]|uniref:ATP-binding protein n=1 Tax=Paraglaciecola chathamensis TaxID=368405 RepID=UPI0027038B31|nr:ATP-binding protein [Paraglaciecola chathamensis]MDO6841168.1 ATP-binding protein [Paraglaciecola chathamensis]
MQSLKDRIEQLGKTLGKQNIPESYTDYKTVKLEHEALANRDVRQLQKEGKRSRIQTLHGRSDLNPKWTFDNLIEDSEDVKEAISIAHSFIAAHEDTAWRKSGSHMMIFYGDYGRGKSHTAGAIAHELINQYEITVLYRQLSTLLEMRFFSYDYSATDKVGEKFREINQELLDVDLLILDEVCVNESSLKKNAQSWLGNLLRQRLAHNKNCILITNHNLAQLEQALGSYCFESIKEYDTYKVRFEGPSRRKEIIPSQVETHRATGYQPNQVK